MIGFDFNKVSQWVGNKTKGVAQFIGNKAKKIIDTVKAVVDFPKFVLDAVKIYTELTHRSIIKNSKPLLDGLEYISAFISDKAYDWIGNKRRNDTINIKGKVLTKLYDDEHAVCYQDDKFLYIGYRGTEPRFNITAKGSIERTINDLLTDAEAALGSVPKTRTDAAVAFYKKIKSMSNKAVKVITGHSLGGYLAKHVHFKTGKKNKTIIFNAFEHPNQKNQRSNKLIVHRIFGDPVSTWSGVSTPFRNIHLYKMQYLFPHIGAHSLDLFL